MITVELQTKNGRAVVPQAPTSNSRDQELRDWARRHVERVHRLKLHIAAYVVGMLVLTPIWALIEWHDHGSFKHFG